MAEDNHDGEYWTQEMGASGRAGYAPDMLWLDADRNRLPLKYLYEPEVGDALKTYFGTLLKFWGDKTCIQFKDVGKHTRDDWCSVKENGPTLVIQKKNYAFAYYGMQHEQCTDLAFSDYPVWLSNTLVMYALGMIPEIFRNDSSKYVSTNFENFNEPTTPYQMRAYRSQLGLFHRCRGQGMVLPFPFDYMSPIMMSSYMYGNSQETIPVFVTMDPSHQYLLDYHIQAGLPPTFYDVLAVNTVYKCIPDWADSCKQNGMEVPKCNNHGYVDITCECRCPPAFTGDRCENKNGAFPYPLQNGAFEIALVDDKDYDFAQLDITTANRADAILSFKFYVFINIRIKPKDPNRLPSIKLFLPFEKVGKLLAGKIDDLMNGIAQIDCEKGIRLLWGNSKRDGRRLACECMSMLAANETEENARVVRGREPNMTMTLVNNFGSNFNLQDLSVESSKFRLLTQFVPRPVVTVMEKFNTPTDGSRTTGSGSTPAGLISATGAAGAMTGAAGSGALMGLLATGGGLLLLLCLLLLFFLKRRKKKKQEDDLGEEEEEGEGEGSESGSEDGGVEVS